MFIHSYKNYLRLLEKGSRISPISKVILIAFGAFLIIAGTASAVIYYQYKNEIPLQAQNQYFDLSHGGFVSISQSIEELLATFKVAGTKTELIEKSKESSAQASGFFVSLDDTQKTLSKIELTKENIRFQKNLLEEKITPEIYLDLNNKLLNFYKESEILIDNISSDYQFTKELLLALGPDFYLPALTNESLWNSGNEQEIISYYQKIKESANVSLGNLQKLSVPETFKGYYDTQLKYFELVVHVSNNVINTLQSQNDTDVDSATQIEKAYQLLVGASRENEEISQKLLEEKLKLFDLKKNLEKFSSLELSKNSLQTEFIGLLGSQPQSKMDQIKIWQSIQKFFRGVTSVY